MNLRIDRAALTKSVEDLAGIATEKGHMPILGNILIQTLKDEVKLTATDLEVRLYTSVPAEVIEPGWTTVNAKALANMLKAMSGPTINLRTVDEFNLKLRGESFKGTLFGLNPADFPIDDSDEVYSAALMDSDPVIDAIDKTISSVTLGDDMYNLAGVRILNECRGKPGYVVATMVSTDTQRMCAVQGFYDECLSGIPDGGVTVPVIGLKAVKALARKDDMICLGFDSKHLYVSTYDYELSVRLLDGLFPDYHKVIPDADKLDVSVAFNRKVLLKTLKRIGVMAKRKLANTVEWTIDDGSLIVNGDNPKVGHVEETVPAETSGGPFTIRYNNRLLIEMLSTMKSETVTYQASTSGVTCLFTGPEDPGYLGVLVSTSQ